MNKTIKLMAFLAIISALSGLLIGFVNELVGPTITTNEIKAEKQKLALIFPTAKEEDFITKDFNDESGYILSFYEVKDQGYVVKASGTGYNNTDNIIILIGFDEEGTLFSIKTIQQQETSGYGAKCFEDEYLEKLYYNRGLDQEVDLLSGATFTSTAMKNMVSAAQAVIKEAK